MQVMYRVNDVLGYYGGSPWDFEKIGELVYPWLDQMPMVTPKSAAKPKAAPVQSGRIGQYARDVERVAEQVMVPDFGLEQFRRWQRQPRPSLRCW